MADGDDRALQIAALRYRIIAEAAEADEGGVTAAIAEAAEREYRSLDGGTFDVGERTLWRWLEAYRSGGLAALKPRSRADTGQVRAFTPEVLQKAARLRRAKKSRATKTIIDILERTQTVSKGAVCRSTLDRHLEHMGLSRRQLGGLGKTTYRKVKTDAPLDLVIADFHHGPYVRVGNEDKARRALLLAFIDHFSRYILEGRYYLHEDFAALRFGFRRLLLCLGLFVLLYIDNGPSFQSARFHAACSSEDLGIQIVHSKPYVSEGRGVCERFNRTVKEQFESEVRGREELLSLDELNAYYEAWLAERYHQDIHSETAEAPAERFTRCVPPLRPAPDLERIEELLRLRQRSKVHKKWSTVQVKGTRYVVDTALRGRRVHSLYDPFDPSYVLVEFDGRVVQRAWPQKAGEVPPQPEEPDEPKDDTDYLALLRRDYEQRTQNELAALDLRPRPIKVELALRDLVELLETCRGAALSKTEHRAAAACLRKLQPIDPAAARTALQSAKRRLGTGLHIRIYLDDLQHTLVRKRTKGKNKP
jgi:transposase InsO family protein